MTKKKKRLEIPNLYTILEIIGFVGAVFACITGKIELAILYMLLAIYGFIRSKDKCLTEKKVEKIQKNEITETKDI